jgi:glycolate oxidase
MTSDSDSHRPFGKLDAERLGELVEMLDPEQVVDRPEDLVAVGVDASREHGRAEALVYPRTTADVSRICRWCSTHRIPLYPRGAGTNLTGGAFPMHGGLVLDFTRMDAIRALSPRDMTAVVEPGLTTGDLKAAAAAHGLFYPPDPASADYSTIGGNVAECAGGLSGVKYGVTRDYVLGLEAVLADGQVLHLGRSTLKDVVGYDLARLLVGSEGTLAVITEATLKLLPKPETRHVVLAAFAEGEAAAEAAFEVLGRRVLPRALEWMDHRCIGCQRGSAPAELLPEEAGAMLLAELDGPHEQVAREAAVVEETFRERGAWGVHLADTEQDCEHLWSVRRGISPSLFKLAPLKLNEDVCLPRSKVLEFLHRMQQVQQELPALTICHFGHIGDGNIHVNVMFDRNDEARRQAEEAVGRLFRVAVDLGGSLSGEHGIGTKKAAYLSLELGEAELALMKRVKRLFDPEGILNPGKMFPQL